MPPGYEHIIGPSTNAANKGVTRIGTSAVKNRLGPPSGTNTGIKRGGTAGVGLEPSGSSIPNITRTISNPHTIDHGQHQQYSDLPQSRPAPLSYEIHPLGNAQATSPIETPRENPSQLMYQNTPAQHFSPPNQIAPYSYPPHQTPPTYPPTPQPVQQAPPGQGPPYPLNDPVSTANQVCLKSETLHR